MRIKNHRITEGRKRGNGIKIEKIIESNQLIFIRDSVIPCLRGYKIRYLSLCLCDFALKNTRIISRGDAKNAEKEYLETTD